MSPADPTQGISRAVPPIVIEELKKRFHGFPVPVPPKLVDLTTVSPEQLEQYGLPPRPDPVTQPLLREVWDRAFGKPVILDHFSVDERLIDDVRYRPQVRRVYERLVTATRFETSRNWSGAYITANRGKHFIQIWAFWTIPGNLKLPPGGPPGIDYVCSNWIGLDGQRLYFDSSLPQIGTQSTLQANGTIKAEAWTQWWARDLLTNEPPLPLPAPFKVVPGNHVAAVLTVIDPQTVNCVMVNLSLLTGISVMATSPPVILPDKTIAMPEIAGATAEWVVERPAVYPPLVDPFWRPSARQLSRLRGDRIRFLPGGRRRQRRHRLVACRAAASAGGRAPHPHVRRAAKPAAYRTDLDARAEEREGGAGALRRVPDLKHPTSICSGPKAGGGMRRLEAAS